MRTATSIMTSGRYKLRREREREKDTRNIRLKFRSNGQSSTRRRFMPGELRE